MAQSQHDDRFTLVARAKSFAHAWRGIRIFLKSTHNAWVQIAVFFAAIALGLYLRLGYIDWVLIIIAGGLVLAAEAFNTAIEIDIDLTSPEFHPFARDTKDVAAGAVLLTSMTAVAIGAIVFGHALL